VFFRPYAGTESDWRSFGETPLVDVAAPLGVGLWRLEQPGREGALLALRNPGVQLGNEPFADSRELVEGVDFSVPLPERSRAQPGMVLVPALPALLTLIADGMVHLSAFHLDRHEVTNREFREFVLASGYAEASLWQDLPFDGARDGWRAAVKSFVDLTGRPGPASWEAGTYPDGKADHPVTGISWYEAVAYCRYRGKELPTAYHWYRAASSVFEYWDSLGSAIVLESNFAGRGLEPVGQRRGVGPFGTYDMAGNAREWLWNQGTSGRLIAGGAFDQPAYLYSQLEEAPPADRSPVNGVRCMRAAEGGPVTAAQRQPILRASGDREVLEPVGDAAYAVLAQQLEYRSRPFEARVEAVPSSNPAWTRQRVTLPTGYDGTTFSVHLFLPASHAPPHPVVVYFPHAGELAAGASTEAFDPSSGGVRLDFLPKSGRALAVVAFDGSFERRWTAERRRTTTPEAGYRTRLGHWRQELGRTLDHFATRDDLAAGKVGWFGISFGAIWMVPLLAVEERIGAAVLYSGGAGYGGAGSRTEKPFNYLPRITVPVLMLNGRWDIDVTPAAQRWMLELLGTRPDHKRQVSFDSGHGNLPRFQVEHATLDWFDHHLGPVGSPVLR
jgi:hypothetical protein